MTSRGILVLNPSAESSVPAAHLATRPESLSGRVVGVLDNHKYGADHYLARVEKLLAARFDVAEFVHHQKETPARPVPADVMDQLASCDVVVSGIAD